MTPVLTDAKLDSLETLAAAATPGEWGWYGSADTEIYLATRDRGRLFIMRFVRKGMQGAQPLLQPIVKNRGMVRAMDHLIFEVAPDATSRDDPRVYRGDIVGIRHPDAAWIAAADPTTVGALIAEVRRLRADAAASTSQPPSTALPSA